MPEIKIELIGDTALIARLSSMPQKVHLSVLKKVYELAESLKNLVLEKLSGQVLNVRSGRLRRSIQQKVEDNPDAVTGVVFQTSDVPYGKIHEYGGIIHHPGGTAYWLDSKTGEIRFVSNKFAALAIKGAFPRTRPHDIPMPERSYMRSSLADKRHEITIGLKQAITEGMK